MNCISSYCQWATFFYLSIRKCRLTRRTTNWLKRECQMVSCGQDCGVLPYRGVVFDQKVVLQCWVWRVLFSQHKLQAFWANRGGTVHRESEKRLCCWQRVLTARLTAVINHFHLHSGCTRATTGAHNKSTFVSFTLSEGEGVIRPGHPLRPKFHQRSREWSNLKPPISGLAKSATLL